MRPIVLPNSIESKDSEILLEGYSRENQEELWNLIVSDREHPKRKGIWPGIETLESLRSYMNTCDFADSNSEEFGYLIRLGKEQAVGTFPVHGMNWSGRTCEVGYWLHHAHMGKGIVSESLRSVEAILKSLGFEKAVIETAEWNRKAWAIAERGGYHLLRRLHEGRDCAGCDDCQRIYEKVFA